jgi:hypothetical protein
MKVKERKWKEGRKRRRDRDAKKVSFKTRLCTSWQVSIQEECAEDILDVTEPVSYPAGFFITYF